MRDGEFANGETCFYEILIPVFGSDFLTSTMGKGI